MGDIYFDRFDLVKQEIELSSIIPYARLDNFPNSFTRTRKMPIDDLIFSMFGKKGLTTSMEIRKYFEEKKEDISISKQAYLNQRKKLNYEVFVYVNRIYLTNYYQNIGSSDLFSNYVVLAVEGTKAEIPASKENISVLGK